MRIMEICSDADVNETEFGFAVEIESKHLSKFPGMISVWVTYDPTNEIAVLWGKETESPEQYIILQNEFSPEEIKFIKEMVCSA